jgi:nucleoid-associated protein YgaU
MPSAPPLAYPTFTQPVAHTFAPPASLHVASASTHPAMPAERAHISIAREAEKIDGTNRVQVKSGDTLWVLARKYLGHGKDWLLLAAQNPQVTAPTDLEVGTWLNLPREESVVRNSAAPNSESPQRVRVERGDSLWTLSQARFGDGRSWGCIAQANPEIQDANLILPGQMLTIPGSCAAGALHRGPSLAVSASELTASTPPRRLSPH